MKLKAPAWPALAIAATVFLIFWPTLTHQFVTWDDDGFLYLNPYFRGLDWAHLRWMFTTFLHGPYQPVAWLSFAVDYLIWGMSPGGFHLSGLLWHCANAALVFILCRRLLALAAPQAKPSSRASAAAFAALLFALHPLRVEPVAWATARRDLISGFFLLCAVLCHLRRHEQPGRYRYWRRWTVLCYCVSLLAKPMAIGLPLVLILLDTAVLPPRKNGRTAWKDLPFYLIPALGAAWLALKGQAVSGAMAAAENFSWTQRLAQACYGHAFYLVKTIWPSGLAPIYGRALRFDPLGPTFLAAGALSLAVAAAAFSQRRRMPSIWAAWLSYLILLAPVLGAVKYGTQLVADRYSYLPALPLSLLAGAAMVEISAKSRRAAAVLACGVIVCLSVLCRRQLAFWQDSETLYRRVLAVDPNQAVARNNLGLVYDHQGRLPKALEQYRLALEVRPHFAEARNDMGTTWIRLGRLDEAEAAFRQAMTDNPRLASACNNLGLIQAKRGHWEKALELFEESLRLDPNYVQAARNRELVLRLAGKQKL